MDPDVRQDDDFSRRPSESWDPSPRWQYRFLTLVRTRMEFSTEIDSNTTKSQDDSSDYRAICFIFGFDGFDQILTLDAEPHGDCGCDENGRIDAE